MKKIANHARSVNMRRFYGSLGFLKQLMYLKATPESLVSTRYAESLEFYV